MFPLPLKTHFWKGRSIGTSKRLRLQSTVSKLMFSLIHSMHVSVNRLVCKVFSDRLRLGFSWFQRTFPLVLNSSYSKPQHHLLGMLNPENSQILKKMFIYPNLRNIEFKEWMITTYSQRTQGPLKYVGVPHGSRDSTLRSTGGKTPFT